MSAKLKRLGRPSALNSELLERICTILRGGNYRDVAARSVGVTPRTIANWMNRGKRDTEGIYHDFFHAVHEAECAAEKSMVALVGVAAVTDARHAEWWLERKFPERWSANRNEIRELKKQVALLLAEVVKARVQPAPASPPGDPASPPVADRESVE